MENKKQNAVITAKTTKSNYQVLVMQLSLKSGEVVECEITLNPYNKKGLGKLYYKIFKNI